MRKDLKGKRFGKLLVVEEAEKRNGRIYWLCKCDCGNENEINGCSLKSGGTKSCGCLRLETSLKNALVNKKKRTEYARKWRETHRPYLAEARKKRRLLHNLENLKRRARLKKYYYDNFYGASYKQIEKYGKQNVIDVYNRNEGRCEMCSIYRKPHIALEIHHKDQRGSSYVQKGKLNNSPDNLMLLCCKCHNAEHKKLNKLY